jgi:predicted hydrocarbon binding protein
MTEARIGRIAAAALHQALADRLPLRLEFYENWLKPMRLRAGTVGLAAFLAVLSFLRDEDDREYRPILRLAGRYAAEWTYATTSRWSRFWRRQLPLARRTRAALDLARQLVEATSATSRGTVRWRRGTGVLEIRGSVFCEVRTPRSEALCDFYVGALDRYAELLGLELVSLAEACRATGSETCRLRLGPRSGGSVPGGAPPDARAETGPGARR